jgi:hypothetical protein
MAVFITLVIPLLHEEPNLIADTNNMDASLYDGGTEARSEFPVPTCSSEEDASSEDPIFSLIGSVGVSSPG